MKCYHCDHYNIENGICDFDNCEILNPWENIDCEYLYEEKMKTVFARITASPEVLALELVTLDCDGWWAYVGIGKRKSYPTREEALAATVAKLKEISK